VGLGTGRSGFYRWGWVWHRSGRRTIEEDMTECNERRMSDVIRSRVGRRAVGATCPWGAKGISCRTPRALPSGRVGEAIFGKNAIKSIPR